jgi:putative ABC transport system permease protein
VLLRPIPYPAENPDAVVVLSENTANHRRISVAYPNFKDIQSEAASFESVAAYRRSTYNLTGLDEPIRLRVHVTTFNYFNLMGVAPVLGRFYTEEEDQPGAAGVAVLNDLLWRNRFGGDQNVIGRPIELNDEIYTIVGVLPPDFEIDTDERAYIPLEPWADNPGTQDRGNHQGIFVTAKMRDDVTFGQVVAEMETFYKQLETEHPNSNSGLGVNVDRLNELRVEDYRATLLLVMGAVTLVLLIVCSNVANLLLARAVNRRREFAIQTALGAARRRLIQQGLTEGVLLAVIGGVLGVVLAYWSLSLLRGMLPAEIPRLHMAQIDWRVLGYGLVVSVLTGTFFGTVPAILATRTRPADPLREGGRDTGSRGFAGRALLVSEVALATVLLIGAFLLIRSVYELTRVDPGFRPDHLLTMQVQLPSARYPMDQRIGFFRQLQEQMEALPGVESATVALNFPVTGYNWSSIFIVRDKPVPPRENLPSSVFSPVDVSYFRTMGIPLHRGRTFEDSDDADARRVIVVNETLAQRMWPGEDAIGKLLKQGWPESEGENNPWREVIGVVGDTRQEGLEEEIRMETYIPLRQLPVSHVNVGLRTQLEPLSLVEPAKSVIRSLDPNLPVYDIETMDHAVAATFAPKRLSMLLLGIFAALALVLAAVGLYGVIAYSVAGRTREIGVRMALGAKRSEIFGMVLREGMLLSVLGAMLGIGAALGLSRVLAGFLYGVTPKDPATFIVVPAVLVLVSLAACAAPARSATRIDPMNVLRYE